MTPPVPEAYHEVRVAVPAGMVDMVCDFVIENIVSGLVLEDEDGCDETTIIFYVTEPQTEELEKFSCFLAGQVPDMISEIPAIRQKRIENIEWMEKYRESVKTIRLADDLVVRPTWAGPTDDKYQLVIEPKMAFGTGSHATTRSCLKLIREHFQSGWRFLDIGCGSGILSILADQMGASTVKAIDYDLAAIANCRENFEINNLRAPFEIVIGSIEKCQNDQPYQFVCANIIRSTILTMLPRILELTATDGVLLLSGLLEKDEAAISEALRSRGQDQFSITPDEEWRTFAVRKQ